jgi:hypothetical protein
MCFYIDRYVRKLLPDPRSRVASIFVAIIALALSLYWLVSTTRSKWLYGIAHPQQLVSYDSVASLPSFFGHIISNEIGVVNQDNISDSFFAVVPFWM